MTEQITYAEWVARRDSISFDVRPFINGRRVESYSSQQVQKADPSNGKALYAFAEGAQDDVDAAVAAARAAFDDGGWRYRPVFERKAILHRLADLLERDAEAFALIEASDVGKPIRDALHVDIPLAVSVLRHNAEAADHIIGGTYPTDGGSLAMSVRAPRGVVGAIVGWNFPLVLAVMKIGPALVTGNSLVLKPSELSSVSALMLAELAQEAGVPDGVLNILPGLGATIGNAMAHHPDIDMISFTGSTATGKRLMAASAASNMKRLLLECGGKSPNIVFSDAPDIQLVAAGVFQKMFWNQGQVCSAGTRLIVERGVKDHLLELVQGHIKKLRKGHPLDPDTDFGPLISEAQRDKVLGFMSLGREQGAELYCGGSKALDETDGFYVEPTIFANVDPSMTIVQEEIFGPVLSVMEFETLEEAVSLANSTSYGLSATAWTTSLPTAQRLIRDIKAGGLTVMGTGAPSAGAPFGSMPVEPHGQSGVGVEGGVEGLASYTISKTVEIFA